MTTPTRASLYTQGFGTRPEGVEIPFYASRPPTTGDTNHPIGKVWIDQTGNASYTLTNISTIGGVASATWATSSNSSALNTLTGNTGGAISPVAGNINLVGSGTTRVIGTGNTLTISASTNGFPITPYVVGPIGTAGYQTIQSAVTAATNDGGGIVYIQPGTYTENVTMGANVHLIAVVGTSGNTTLLEDGGEVPAVSIIGNFTLNVTAAMSTPTTVIKNILFSATSGNVFSYLGNTGLLESGYLTFWGCQLQTNGASNIFHIDGFFNINLVESFINEVTPNTSNLMNFGATPFLNLNCRDSVVEINKVNANTVPASSFLVFLLENTAYYARIDLSAVSASLQFTANNCFIDFNGTSGSPLINFGANDSSCILQNCTIAQASGSIANSTASDASAVFNYTSCVFNNPLTIGSTGRGNFVNCTFSGANLPCVTMSSSQNVSFVDCIFDSTHTPAITGSGSGTIKFANAIFINNPSIANTLTVSWFPTQTGNLTVTGSLQASQQVYAGGDIGGSASTISLTNSNSTTISTGTGTVKMSSTNNANNGAWIKIYVGTTAYWVPAWTTNSP